ncbi:LytR/AlgR family response regulator transcription factor [Larkinella soli]|uniref:LytR/AlgR family response regulator transcription factor n=1 Tax=Larkinella soli TaxID=1770527 RepID=UPI000FFB738F|nr:LytTR family DNA-binding domain-containing protein [Larkinella soli]
MNVLLIEDEQPAAKRLTRMLTGLRPDLKVLDVIDSVEASVKWLQTFPRPDLMFLDIQLADGISFDIFKQVEVKTPVIFTTAYDEYTLKAFKVNSVDYLLKPIDPEELSAALDKYDSLTREPAGLAPELEKLLKQLSVPKPTYKERLLVKTGQQLAYVPVDSLAYLFSDEGLTFAVDAAGKRWILDYTLDQTETFLPPRTFFRISRKFIVRISSILRIHTYFNSRLKLDLQPATAFEVIVSRERVGEFKEWLDQ